MLNLVCRCMFMVEEFSLSLKNVFEGGLKTNAFQVLFPPSNE